MREARVAELMRIANANPESKNIQVRKYRGYYAGNQQPRGDSGCSKCQPYGQRYRYVREDGWH